MQLLINADVYAPQAFGFQNLLVGGGRVLWMGSEKLDLTSPLDVETVDLQGRKLVPGFLDMHAHVTGGGGESGFASRVPPVSVNAFTEAGVTTVVGLLGTDDTIRTTGSLLAQTRALREEGISAFCFTGGYHIPPTTLTGSVREDIVHVDPIIGVGEIAISDHRSSQPTLDELLRLASDAHVAGMMSGKAGILHLHLGDGERGLDLINAALDNSEIPPRVFNPTHVNRQPALFEQAKKLAKRGCFVDITAFPVDDSDPALAADDAWMALADVAADRITLSSDGGGCLPHFDENGRITGMEVGQPNELIIAVRRLLKRGVGLEQVLPALTSNVADLLRFPNKGRLFPGCDADLVVLDEEFCIDSVMAKGVWHVRSGVQTIKGRFEK